MESIFGIRLFYIYFDLTVWKHSGMNDLTITVDFQKWIHHRGRISLIKVLFISLFQQYHLNFVWLQSRFNHVRLLSNTLLTDLQGRLRRHGDIPHITGQ